MRYDRQDCWLGLVESRDSWQTTNQIIKQSLTETRMRRSASTSVRTPAVPTVRHSMRSRLLVGIFWFALLTPESMRIARFYTDCLL